MESTKTIEELVMEYQASNDDQVFTELYVEVKQAILSESMAINFARRSGISIDVLDGLFDEAILYTIDAFKEGQTFVKLVGWKFKKLRINYSESQRSGIQRLTEHITPKYDKDGEEMEVDFRSDYDLLAEVERRMTAKRKADQLALIDFLVSGEDARTTAIVQAYLTTEYATPTAIGKHLGLDHKQVTRALNRLAARFDTKQFGSHRDYLAAL